MIRKHVNLCPNMRLLSKAIAVTCMAVSVFAIGIHKVDAAEGTSYQLYGTNDDYLLRTEKVGTDYTINEANYENEPIQGSSFVVYQSPKTAAVVTPEVPEKEEEEIVVPPGGGLRPESIARKKYPSPIAEPRHPAAPEIRFVRVKEILEKIKRLAPIMLEPIEPEPVVSPKALPTTVAVSVTQECPVPPAQQCVPNWTLFWCLLLAILIPWLLLFLLLCIETYRNRKRPIVFSILFSILVMIVILAVFLFAVPRAHAKTTVPLKTTYYGYLFDNSGNAITAAHNVRFSYWSSSDYVASDVTATGAINTAASTYADWTEVHTVTPNSDGYFFVKLGNITALPDFSTLPRSTLLDMYLQVEVKPTTSADTAYDFLDHDTTSDTEDRNPMLSVPFALNADFIDQREIGTGSGNIVILNSGGLLDVDVIPGGTNRNRFTIDYDNTSTGDIVLQFGNTLSKTLLYSQDNSRFEFNDDVYMNGDLTVTGLINGLDLGSLAAGTDTQLKVSSGAGLTVNIAAGGYRISGTETQYAGDSGIAIADENTNYVYFSSGGVQVNTTGFETGSSIIKLAEVTATGGAVSTVNDRRVMQSDDRERTIKQTFFPEYDNVSYQADATNNVGRMYIDSDNTNKKNFYVWTSTSNSLQDYDIILHIPLSPDFKKWAEDNTIKLRYRSTSSDTANNKLDVSVFDTNGSPVTLSGSSTDLANTSWTNTIIEFSGSPTWTPGQDFVIKLKVYAKDNYQMQSSDLRIRYVEFPSG